MKIIYFDACYTGGGFYSYIGEIEWEMGDNKPFTHSFIMAADDWGEYMVEVNARPFFDNDEQWTSEWIMEHWIDDLNMCDYFPEGIEWMKKHGKLGNFLMEELEERSRHWLKVRAMNRWWVKGKETNPSVPDELKEMLGEFTRLTECGAIRSYYDSEAPEEYKYKNSKIIHNLFCALEEMADSLEKGNVVEAEDRIREFAMWEFLDGKILREISETVDAYYTVNKEFIEEEKTKELKEQMAWLNTITEWWEK